MWWSSINHTEGISQIRGCILHFKMTKLFLQIQMTLRRFFSDYAGQAGEGPPPTPAVVPLLQFLPNKLSLPQGDRPC